MGFGLKFDTQSSNLAIISCIKTVFLRKRAISFYETTFLRKSTQYLFPFESDRDFTSLIYWLTYFLLITQSEKYTQKITQILSGDIPYDLTKRTDQDW